MDRPNYANAFAATYNPQTREVFINFVQEYPVIDPECVGHELKKQKESVGCVALPEAIANQLSVALNNMLTPVTKNE